METVYDERGEEDADGVEATESSVSKLVESERSLLSDGCADGDEDEELTCSQFPLGLL